MKYDNPHVSPLTPRRGGPITRLIGDSILLLLRWKVTGKMPNEPKLIIIGAPHTSNWDLFISLGTMMATGIDFSFLMKEEAFRGPLGWLWRALGGIPINRKNSRTQIKQVRNWFNNNETAVLGITPEGTRKKVEQYKKGYLLMAKATKVPLFIIGVDCHKRTIHMDRIWTLTGDNEADNIALKTYIDANFSGYNPDNA